MCIRDRTESADDKFSGNDHQNNNDIQSVHRCQTDQRGTDVYKRQPFHCVYQLIFVHNLNHRTNSSVRVLHLKDAMENGIYVDKKGESRTPSPSTKERIKSMFRLSLKK